MRGTAIANVLQKGGRGSKSNQNMPAAARRNTNTCPRNTVSRRGSFFVKCVQVNSASESKNS